MKTAILSVILAIFLAGPIATENAEAIQLCDGFGFVWNVTVIAGGAFQGSVRTNNCGTVPVSGGFTPSGAGIFFTMYADQTPSGACCEGFMYVGNFGGGNGSGSWYNSPDCGGSGSFSLQVCADDLPEPFLGGTPGIPGEAE